MIYLLSMVSEVKSLFISSLPDDNNIDRVMAELPGFDNKIWYFCQPWTKRI